MGFIFYWQNYSCIFWSFWNWIYSSGSTVLNKIRDKSITHNLFRIQDNESIMCGFHGIVFIEYMLSGKTC